ncbi:MAG: adenosine deaminase [Candidatus Eisenbacteria bacterium]|nr:adenosine deaminase [Candidatus Eisenbacteria bacterium]
MESGRHWLHGMPKLELHLHLEGAIPHNALWQLIQKYGGDPEIPDQEALERKFQYPDFPGFIQTWLWKNTFLREYEDFAFVAEAVARSLAEQNILYAEVFFSPGDFARFGLKTQRIAEAIRAGLAREARVRVALIADLIRDFPPERAARTLAEAAEVKALGIVGVGLGGSEQEFPPEPFAPVYEEARRLGFHTTAHAGEAAGSESVWGALRSLRAERIGHATRAEEDPKLLDYLAEHRIPLELCPVSNIRTGVVGKIEDHPVRRYFDRGLLVTVNTDDPGMFGNSLAGEYRLLEERLGFSHEEIRRLTLNALEASWLPGADIERLRGVLVTGHSERR